MSVVRDAIETLAPEAGGQTLSELRALGDRLVTTDEVLARVAHARA